jgi:hypothetical protein
MNIIRQCTRLHIDRWLHCLSKLIPSWRWMATAMKKNSFSRQKIIFRGHFLKYRPGNTDCKGLRGRSFVDRDEIVSLGWFDAAPRHSA